MMSSLNSVAFKCNVALKMIKHDFIKPKVEGKSRTSYHWQDMFVINTGTEKNGTFRPEKFRCVSHEMYEQTSSIADTGFLPNELFHSGGKYVLGSPWLLSSLTTVGILPKVAACVDT